MNDEIIVDEGPLAPGRVLVTQDLYSADRALSAGSRELGVREGGVTIGIPTVYTLWPADFPAMARRPDVHRWRYLLVHFRFDLEELSSRRRYNEARFIVEFDHPQTVALSLHPELVVTTTDVEKSRIFTLGPTLAFTDAAEISLGDAAFGRRFRFTQLHPVITSFGAGRGTFSWTFTAQENAALIPCSRATFALLQLPTDTAELNGRFKSEVVVSRKVLGIFEPITADADAQAFTFRPDEGTFVPAPPH
jgi:hypothetical protein